MVPDVLWNRLIKYTVVRNAWSQNLNGKEAWASKVKPTSIVSLLVLYNNTLMVVSAEND